MNLLANATIYVGFALAIYSFLIMTLGISTKNQKLVNSGKGGVIAILVCSSLAMIILLYFWVHRTLSTNTLQTTQAATCQSYTN